MTDSKEMQKVNAERIVSQFYEVRAELKNRVEDADLDKIAATLTAALPSSDRGAKAIGITDGRPKYVWPRR